MKVKKESHLLGTLFKKLSRRARVHVLIEPRWKVAGRITLKNGAHRYFRFNSVDLNTLGSSRIASDKDFANFFMRKLGYPTVQGKTFFRSDFAAELKVRTRSREDAYRYAEKIGFPVVAKPNGGAQGTGVFFVHDKKELYRALEYIFKHDRVALIQRIIRGRDYRIVVLDGEVISAYERIPLNVIGDGTSTIKQLLERKMRQFVKDRRDTKIRLHDERMILKLKRAGLTLRSVPEKEKRIYLLDNANLSSGGDAVDATRSIHRDFKYIAVRLTKDMGLRFAGVDIMVDGDIAKEPSRYHVLEINDTPGLDHYASSGKAQRKIVEDLYLKVLKRLAR